MEISRKSDENLERLNEIFSGCFDIVRRELTDINGKKVIVVFSDGLVNKEQIQQFVLSPLLGFALREKNGAIENLEDIQKKLLSAADVKPERDMDEAVKKCLSGDTALFVEGATECLIVQTRGWQSRGIAEPSTQKSIRGPKEGFTETLLFNVAMIRRKIRTPDLKMEIMQIGDETRTDVCIAYIKGVAEDKVVAEVRGRLQSIDARYILESGHIEQLVEDNKRTIFSTVANNEKPDAVAGKLLKGRVAIIVDGTPFVLTVPMVFAENFQAVEDYYTKPYYANFIRILRYVAYVVTIVLPAVYVALVTYHQEMIPDQLLTVLIEAIESVPMPPVLEMFIMLIFYELLKEALLRLPSQIASAVGIAGVFIIGDAAVNAHLIGAPTVVIAAMTFITSAVVNAAMDSSAVIRIILLVLGAAFGVFGVFIGIFLVLTHLCTLKSFGHPFMAPFSPFRFRGFQNIVLRQSTKEMLKRDGS